jgi:hypothetical protein
MDKMFLNSECSIARVGLFRTLRRDGRSLRQSRRLQSLSLSVTTPFHFQSQSQYSHYIIICIEYVVFKDEECCHLIFFFNEQFTRCKGVS